MKKYDFKCDNLLLKNYLEALEVTLSIFFKFKIKLLKIHICDYLMLRYTKQFLFIYI